MLCVALLAVTAAPLTANASTVYIIRHGEKTFHGGCLDIQGQERANNLMNLFNSSSGRFSTPTALFANQYNYLPECERCWLTVQPIAQRNRLAVNFDEGYQPWVGGNAKAAAAIVSAAKTNSVILVAWEHYNIQFLTEDLGVSKSKIPTWGSEDFDTVYVLQLDASSGALISFSTDAQKFVPQSTTCPPVYVPPPGQPGDVADGEIVES